LFFQVLAAGQIHIVVMLRHRASPFAISTTGSSGVSNTPQLRGFTIDVTEYWIARLRGR
jgi:hypothetical protein